MIQLKTTSSQEGISSSHSEVSSVRIAAPIFLRSLWLCSLTHNINVKRKRTVYHMRTCSVLISLPHTTDQCTVMDNYSVRQKQLDRDPSFASPPMSSTLIPVYTQHWTAPSKSVLCLNCGRTLSQITHNGTTETAFILKTIVTPTFSDLNILIFSQFS